MQRLVHVADEVEQPRIGECLGVGSRLTICQDGEAMLSGLGDVVVLLLDIGWVVHRQVQLHRSLPLKE